MKQYLIFGILSLGLIISTMYYKGRYKDSDLKLQAVISINGSLEKTILDMQKNQEVVSNELFKMNKENFQLQKDKVMLSKKVEELGVANESFRVWASSYIDAAAIRLWNESSQRD